MGYERTIREIGAATGSDCATAEFIFCIETGELDGDIQVEDAPAPLTDDRRRRAGRRLRPKPKPKRQQ